jgi:high-affinity iron transporter
MGAWFEVYSTWETLAAQALAALLVVGSYFAAGVRQGERPQRQGAEPARRAVAPPATEPA